MKVKKEWKQTISEAALDEADDLNQAARAIEADSVIPENANKGQIFKILHNAYEEAQADRELLDDDDFADEKASDYPNVLFIGGAGVGKTAQIKAWAKAEGANLFTLQGASLDAADMGGLPMIDRGDGTKAIRAQKVGTGILDQLDRPNSVLFLDELNRARPDVRAALLQLICDHVVQDFEADGGMRYFPNFLFTIAAVNPSGGQGYQTYELDSAEKGRFGSHNVTVENDVIMDYLVDFFTKRAQVFEKKGNMEREAIERGRAELAKKLLSSPNFDFDTMESEEEARDDDTWNGLTTSPRNLTLLLKDTNGTKADLLNKWNSHCNNLHLGNVKMALANYVDVENKANDALKGGTQSSLLNKRKASGLDKMRSKYGNL